MRVHRLRRRRGLTTLAGPVHPRRMARVCRHCDCTCPTRSTAHPPHDDDRPADESDLPTGLALPWRLLSIAALLVLTMLLLALCAPSAHAAEPTCDPAVMSCPDADETPSVVPGPFGLPLLPGLRVVTIAPTETATCAETARWRRAYEGARANQVEAERQADTRTAERDKLARDVAERDKRIAHLTHLLVQAPPPAPPAKSIAPEVLRVVLIVGGSLAGSTTAAGACSLDAVKCSTPETIGYTAGAGLVGAGVGAIVAAFID